MSGQGGGSLAPHGSSTESGVTWLRCDLVMQKGTVQHLYCDVCKKYEANIQLLKTFTTTWITGSTNHKVSSVLDHVHKAAMMWLRADHAKAKGQPATMVSPIASLWQMDDKTHSQMRRKIDLCFVMAKESINSFCQVLFTSWKNDNTR